MKLLFSLLLLILAGCSTLPNSKHITTNEGEFTYYLEGKRLPAVIFESGLGDDMTSWAPVINEVQRFSQVFAYNRAGFSGSHSDNETRNGATIVNELRSLLNTANLKPPFILVGHSLGGAYMELYAKMFPNDVAGVVLIDPNSSKYPEQCKREQLAFCDPPSGMPEWATWFFPDAVEGEILGFRTTHSQVNGIETFPNIPLAVLSATHKNEEQGDGQRKSRELYVEMHRQLSTMSETSKFITCDSCSHYIHADAPELVIDAIKWVVAESEN